MNGRLRGADAIARVLAEEGAHTLFGYNGGAILPTFDAIYRYNALREPDEPELRLVVPAGEQGAGFMASGYARATGRAGVFLVTSGPGATNSVTPVRDATADSIPLVLISGQVARSSLGSDAFQEAPVFHLMSACAKEVFLVERPEELEDTVRAAFRIARSGRPGPVVVDVPKDVQNAAVSWKGSAGLALPDGLARIASPSEGSGPDADRFFDLLSRSERPLLYVGGGVVAAGAAPELRAFVDRFRIPAVTTLMALGALDTRHELCLHMLGMHGTAYANYAVEDCDFLIAVGARFDDRVTGNVAKFAPHARFIAHVDVDAAEIGKIKCPQWSYAGDAKRALADLLGAGRSFRRDFSPWVDHVRALKRNHPLSYDRTSSLLQPQLVLECLNEILGGEAIISTGVGQHQMWAAQYLDFRGPRQWLTSGSLGTMGFGLPAAIGAQLAHAGRRVVNIDGDGSIRMSWGELETVTNYGLPVKVLLLNNRGDGMVRQWQKVYFEHRFAASDKTLHRKDFIAAARADGFDWAERLCDPAQARRTLAAFIEHPGPAFLEALIDPEACVYPMVGPGAGYDEMVTGDFIKPRGQMLQ